MDVYRAQPLDPESHEYFSLPAIFIDYSMQGQGTNKPRIIDLTLHVITDELPDASNISLQKLDGLKRFQYHALLQSILEGSRLGSTKPLIFINEGIIDAPVINYHTQTYQFESYLADMLPDDPKQLYGQFDRLNIFGSLKNHHFLKSK
ncbi:MAG: hypothetical protein P1P63_05045 [Treponemataceae bacterium]